jgi:hypothetical protein
MRVSRIPPVDELRPFTFDRVAAAEKFSVTEKTIIRWMKQYGLYEPLRNCGPNRLNMDKAREMRRLHKQGSSVSELSSRYHVTVTTVSRVINHITYRDKPDVAEVTVVYNHIPASGASSG